MSLALDPLQPQVRPRPIAPKQVDESALLPDDEAEQLLDQLLQARWSRLACQDADPLGMLFNDCASQWTMGWEPEQQALLLLVWETDSWQNKPCWSLYRNGQLIVRAIDGQGIAQRNWLNQLLESPKLPVVTPAEFLSRLSDFRYASDSRQAAEQLRQTVAVYPDALAPIQDAVLALLEQDLGHPEWPTLEVLKLHRLSHKNPIISLFQEWAQQRKIQSQSELERFQTAINQLQQDYATLGRTVQPMFQASYQESFQEFKSLHTSCLWRLQMLKAMPSSQFISHAKTQPFRF